MVRLKLAAVLLVAAAPRLFAQTATTPDHPTTVGGGDRDQGQHSATILDMAISPRAVALGEAMGAVAGDPASIWYNAAGLGAVRTNSFLVTGSQRFGDTQLAGAAVTFPTTIGTFGIGARGFNAGTIAETQNNTAIGTCRAYQLALNGGGALELSRHLTIGGSLFYSQETLCSDSRGGVGVNAGILLPDLFGRLTLGGGLRNWGTQVVFDQLGSRPGLTGFAAGALDILKHRDLIQTPLLFKGEPIILDAKLVGEYDSPRLSDPYPMGGIEATVNGVLIGRIGYQGGDDNRRGLSLGAGINVGQFRLEYAYRARKNTGGSFFSFDPLGNEHHVAASFYFGGPSTNQPVVPVIVTQPIDTALINAAVRDAVNRALAQLRPLLDSLRTAQVETKTEDLVARYIVPIHFDFDSAVVRDTDQVVLGEIAEVIKRVYPTALVTIEGFADPAGSDAYNLRLSRRRADAVKRVMVERYGLPANQFKTVGYGQQFTRQVTPGARRTDPGALQNRRVTFTIDATQHY